MPNIRWLLGLVTATHRFLYRVTQGRIGARAGGIDVLLLTTVGRKSGKRRVTPLLYLEDDRRWIVVASNAGDERNPAWWLNLESHPDAEIQIRERRHPVRARRASEQELEQLWPRLIGSYRHYSRYRQRASREIPVVILEPEASPSEEGRPPVDP